MFLTDRKIRQISAVKWNDQKDSNTNKHLSENSSGAKIGISKIVLPEATYMQYVSQSIANHSLTKFSII